MKFDNIFDFYVILKMDILHQVTGNTINLVSRCWTKQGAFYGILRILVIYRL